MKSETQNKGVLPINNNVTAKMISENYSQIRNDVLLIIETEIGKLLDKKVNDDGNKRARKEVNKLKTTKGRT
jgi:hypothetical protein